MVDDRSLSPRPMLDRVEPALLSFKPIGYLGESIGPRLQLLPLCPAPTTRQVTDPLGLFSDPVEVTVEVGDLLREVLVFVFLAVLGPRLGRSSSRRRVSSSVESRPSEERNA